MVIFKLTYKKALSEVEKYLTAHRKYLDVYITFFHSTKHNTANFEAAQE